VSEFDKTMIKYNEAQSIRNTYEHIVRRLKDERLSFNNQLTALERALRAKKRDVDELLQLSSDAHQAKELAQQELHQARFRYEQKRSKREGDLRERQQVLKIRRQMIEKQERRTMKKNDSTDGNNDGERHDDTSTAEELTSYAMSYDKEMEEEQIRKLMLYEESFDKIKSVTGVTFLGDIINKIKSQKESIVELHQLTKQNMDYIEKLKKEKLDLSKRMGEKTLKENPFGRSRKILDEKEDYLSESALQLTKAKKRLETILEITMAAKSGIKNLCQNLKIHNIDCYPVTNEDSEEDSEHYSSLLWVIGDILVKMTTKIREAELDNLHDITLENNSDHGTEQDKEELHNRPDNQRIILPSWNNFRADDDSQSEGSVNNEDDTNLSRYKLKNISTRIARTQKRLRKMEEDNKAH